MRGPSLQATVLAPDSRRAHMILAPLPYHQRAGTFIYDTTSDLTIEIRFGQIRRERGAAVGGEGCRIEQSGAEQSRIEECGIEECRIKKPLQPTKKPTIETDHRSSLKLMKPLQLSRQHLRTAAEAAEVGVRPPCPIRFLASPRPVRRRTALCLPTCPTDRRNRH